VPLFLPIHIVAAGLGLIAGCVALAAAKGATLHRRSGILFVYGMVAMCGSAIVMAVVRGQITNVAAGVLTAYLTVTALTTVRSPSPRVRTLEAVLACVALIFGLSMMTFGFEALASVSGRKFGLPSFPFFVFGAIGMLGSAGDYRMIRAGGLRGVPRLRRHLWRMCTALTITAGSFFSIRARVARILPEPFLSPGARAIPVLFVLAAMLYWLWRVRVRRTSPAARPLDIPAPLSIGQA
jgi:uncharacterized membrane protein